MGGTRLCRPSWFLLARNFSRGFFSHLHWANERKYIGLLGNAGSIRLQYYAGIFQSIFTSLLCAAQRVSNTLCAFHSLCRHKLAFSVHFRLTTRLFCKNHQGTIPTITMLFQNHTTSSQTQSGMAVPLMKMLPPQDLFVKYPSLAAALRAYLNISVDGEENVYTMAINCNTCLQ
jgi:hypothetical protein